jgi:hypothetical protein
LTSQKRERKIKLNLETNLSWFSSCERSVLTGLMIGMDRTGGMLSMWSAAGSSGIGSWNSGQQKLVQRMRGTVEAGRPRVDCCGTTVALREVKSEEAHLGSV